MFRKSLAVVIFCVVLLILPNTVSSQSLILKPRVNITEFQVPNNVSVNHPFSVNVTIENNRALGFLPRYAQVRIYLTNELGLEEKEIGHSDYQRIWLAPHNFTDILCTIPEGDIDWFKERYDLRASVYFRFCGRHIGASSVRGTHVKTPFWEKDKVRITSLSVKESIGSDDSIICNCEKQNEFIVNIDAINEGSFKANTSARVYLIEKPSMIPELDKYGLLVEGFGSIRREIGNSNSKKISPQGDDEFNVTCKLRETEMEKDEFDIQAVLFVEIDGKLYEVDSSALYGIDHVSNAEDLKQALTAIAIITIILLLIFALASVTVRILYPLYKKKKVELQKDLKKLDEEDKK